MENPLRRTPNGKSTVGEDTRRIRAGHAHTRRRVRRRLQAAAEGDALNSVNDPLRVKLDRIDACAVDAVRDELARNLLHAYVACLTSEELCDAAVHALSGSAHLLGAIRTRLLRMGRERLGLEKIDALGLRLMEMTRPRGKVSLRLEGLLAQIYPFLAPPTRQALLDRWLDRGTRGAATRWLKAIGDDELLFSIDDVLDYWRQSRDSRAAKLLAYRAEPERITDILPALIEHCAEGWIVSRAVLRARSVSEDSWSAIRHKFPASYTYLCAKTRRSLSEQEAFAIVDECDDWSDRGLAIWSIGQLGMVSVLDRVWTVRAEFEQRELRRLGIDARLCA